MRQDLGSSTRKALWRRRIIAAVVVGAMHLALFGVVVSDWAKHQRPYEPDTVILTLEPPLREQPKEVQRAAAQRPPPPPPPVLSQAPPGVSPSVRTSPAPGVQGVEPVVVSQGAPGVEVRAEGALNLGCLTPNLKGKAKEDCDRKATVAYLDQPSFKRKSYEPGPPPTAAAPKSPEPGWHLTLFPPGIRMIASPNDKGFPPGLGDTKTTVFEPAEIHDLPTPMK